MSEPNTLSIILDALGVIARAIASVEWSWYFSWLLRIVVLPWKLIMIPISFVFNCLLILFAPAIHLASYMLAGARVIVDFLISLEPLYSFFGSAVAVGVASGVVLGVASYYITYSLGMREDGEDGEDDDRSTSTKRSYLSDLDKHDTLLESPSTGAEWQWLDKSPCWHRPTSGLLSQTIHEEDDDSE